MNRKGEFSLEKTLFVGLKQLRKARLEHIARGFEVDDWDFETQTLKFIKYEKYCNAHYNSGFKE